MSKRTYLLQHERAVKVGLVAHTISAQALNPRVSTSLA